MSWRLHPPAVRLQLRANNSLHAIVWMVALVVAEHCWASESRLTQQATFHIANQPMDTALIEFSKQAGVPVSVAATSLDRIQAAALNGTMEAGTALNRLLDESGLRYEELAGIVTVVRASTETTPPVIHVAAADQVPPTHSGTSSESNQAEASSSYAQNSPGPQQLEQVTVTAQKREESLKNVPISISVLSGPQLESPTVTSAIDALNTVPGVAANQAYLGGGTMVTIRGVASGIQLAAGSSPVAYYVDSVPFNLIREAIGPDQNVYDLQRIEVLNGPQGTLYGASALNGVVRILTKDADPSGFDLKVRGEGSYTDGGGTNYRGDMALNVPIIDGKLAARAVVGYENDSGWIDTPLQTQVNTAELRNYRLKLYAQPTDSLSIGLSAWSTRDDYGAPNTANDSYRNSSVYNRPIANDVDAYSLKLGYDFSGGYSLSSATSYLKYTNDSLLDLSSLVAFPLTVHSTVDSNIFSEEVLLNSPSVGAWRWSLGGMYRRGTDNLFQETPVVVIGGTNYGGPQTGSRTDDTSKSLAGYGQVTRLLVNGRLELTAGLRYFEDHVNQEQQLSPVSPFIPATEGKYNATTPRAVVTWHQNDDLMFYVSYSEGFRSGFPQQGVPGYTNVEPDKLYNYEAGTKGSFWNDRVSFSTAAYYMDWRHVQQSLAVPFGLSYVQVALNGNSASGEGIDIAVTTEPLPGLIFGLTGSWNNLEMDTNVYSNGVALFHKGDRLNYSPETTAGASATYAFALGIGGLMGRLWTSVNYTSAQIFRDTLGSAVLVGPGDPMVIGKGGISIDSYKHWTASLFVDNVNNERGAVIRPFLDPDLYSRVRPRTVGLQLEYHFR